MVAPPRMWAVLEVLASTSRSRLPGVPSIFSAILAASRFASGMYVGGRWSSATLADERAAPGAPAEREAHEVRERLHDEQDGRLPRPAERPVRAREPDGVANHVAQPAQPARPRRPAAGQDR